MKKVRQNENKKGFTIVEMIIVMVIIGVILSSVIAAGQGATNTGRLTSTVATIKALQTAAVNYYNQNGGTYTGGTLGTITLANLASNNMIPANIGSGLNAWNGTISVSPDTNAGYIDITLTNVPATPGDVTASSSGTYSAGSIAAAVSNSLQAVPTYTAKTSTWQGAF